MENGSKQITKLRDRVALLNPLEWVFANYRAGRRRRTVVTLGARWPLFCPPFVLYIDKTWRWLQGWEMGVDGGDP